MKAVAAKVRERWQQSKGPEELFLLLWELALTWSPADRAIAVRPDLSTRHDMRAALRRDDGEAAALELMSVSERQWPNGAKVEDCKIAYGLILEMMRAIESAFEPYHPRTRLLSPAYGSPPPRRTG